MAGRTPMSPEDQQIARLLLDPTMAPKEKLAAMALPPQPSVGGFSLSPIASMNGSAAAQPDLPIVDPSLVGGPDPHAQVSAQINQGIGRAAPTSIAGTQLESAAVPVGPTSTPQTPAQRPSVVIPEKTIIGSSTGPISPVPGVTAPNAPPWQPKTERPRGAAPWLASYMGGPSEGAPVEPAYSIEPTAEPVTTYTEDAAHTARDFKLFPPSVTPSEAGRAMDLAERQAQNAVDTFNAQEYARQAVLRAAKAAQDKQDAIDAENILRERDRQQQLQQAEQSYREMADENLKEPIDSNRSWNRRTTGEKLMGRIGLFLSTVGSGVAGTPNLVWESMQRDIDRDIDAQKANKALRGNRLAAEGSLIGMARDRFRDEAAADAAARASGYARVQAELARFQESAKTPERQAALQSLIDQSAQARLDQEQKLRLALQADEARRRAIMAAANAPRSLMQQAKDEAQFTGYRATTAKNLREMNGQGAEDEPLFVPGVGYARTKEDAKELRELKANYEAGQANLDRAERLMREGGTGTGALGVGTDKYQEGLALKNQLVTNIAKSYGGVIQQSDRDAAEKEVPDPTSWNSGQKQKLDAARRKLDTNWQAQVRAKIKGAPQKFNPKTEKK